MSRMSTVICMAFRHKFINSVPKLVIENSMMCLKILGKNVQLNGSKSPPLLDTTRHHTIRVRMPIMSVQVY